MKKTLLVAAALACGAATAPALAQRVHDVPARPALFAGADTNSAGAYYLAGLQSLDRDARRAAAAFYWAERLNPGWADALYARHVALLMADPRRQQNYVDGRGGIERNPEIMAIDSLYYRAIQRDPFLHRKLDLQYWTLYLRTTYAEAIRDRTGNRDDVAAEYLTQTELRSAEPWLKAAQGRFPAAIDFWQQELRHARNPAAVRLRLGQLRFLSGDFPEAAEDLRLGIEELRKNDTRRVVRFYESKAVMEYSLAVALEQAGNGDGAREGFARALQEDLAFWPGHRRMATLALAKNDTTTALAEMALAVEIAPTEPDLRFEYAKMLITAGKVVPAAAELQKAAELDPFFAEPHFYLAAMHDASSMTDEAVGHYRQYLSLAPREAEHRAQAEQRLAALGGGAAAAAPKP